MSSSSDPVAPGGDVGPDDERHRLGRLLEAVAHECALLGAEIARLGDALSAPPPADKARMVQFQAFDFLTQNAHTLAGLMAHAAGLLGGGGQADATRTLVENVPLPEVRWRLGAALGLPYAADAPVAHEETDLWLHDSIGPSDATAS